MKHRKIFALTCGSIFVSLATAGTASADENRAEAMAARQGSDAAQTQAAAVSEAWRDGKLETVYLLNRHLNNFAIDTEVRGNKAILTGNVESKVDKDLAQELALGIEGIDEVDNHLTVMGPQEADNGTNRSFARSIDEATLVAEVKIELLANDEISGLAIDVDASGSTVMLKGQVATGAERALAEEIAGNVEGVDTVDNKLEVVTTS